MSSSEPLIDFDPAVRRSAYVARALRAAIESGRYGVGSPLPTEMELCRTFSVSRHTVRAALKELSDLGLVERRQGSGTQVISTSPAKAYVQSMRSLQDLTQYARDTVLRVSACRSVSLTPEESALVPGLPGSSWIRINGVRWNAALTDRICATSVFVHMRFERILQQVAAFQGPIYQLVEERSGEEIRSATQDVTAHLMPRPVAKLLGREPGGPAFRFIRRYLDASEIPMVTSINWHAAEGFIYSTRLSLDERFGRS